MAKVMKQIQQRFEMSRRSPGSRKMDLVILLQVLCMRDYTAVLCEMNPRSRRLERVAACRCPSLSALYRPHDLLTLPPVHD